EDSGPIEDSDLVEEPVPVEKSEPAEDDSATQHAEPEEATPAPEQHAYEPLPALPTAPGREQESDQRGLLATLSRWGRRRSR
ncbi:MAG: hypothetical protein Q3974_02135, partial [Rothia sp. (in: high G+C Gram-positive bacteria)]|nr:hypothetical protein [Rothia sp. (in: high G+C Gram-positive bacteria)]